MTFAQYIWRIDFHGHRMVGRTRAWMAVLIHLLCAVLGTAIWTTESPLWVLVLPAAVLAVFWMGTRHNYKQDFKP